MPDELDQLFDQGAFDGGVGPALDAHGGGAAAPTEQHVDDRVDQRAVDDHQAVVIPLLSLENGKHGRQRDAVQVVAKAERDDVINTDLDVVAGEVAQARAHDPHQAIEHDLQHWQAFIGNEAGADDALHAGLLGAAGRVVAKSEQAVDLGLLEHAAGRIFHGKSNRGAAHCTSSSVKSTFSTRAGWAAILVRATSSSRRR